MSGHRRAKPLQLPSAPADVEKRGTITLVPVVFLILIVCAACAIYLWFSSGVNGSVRTQVQPVAAESTTVTVSASGFQPAVENRGPAPGPAPKGMVWIPGGEFSMGANDPPDMDEVGMKATLNARPIHRVYVDGFYMDKTDVTNAQFNTFVRATGYVTVAERTPRAEDFPGAPPENLVAGGVVFSPPGVRDPEVICFFDGPEVGLTCA